MRFYEGLPPTADTKREDLDEIVGEVNARCGEPTEERPYLWRGRIARTSRMVKMGYHHKPQQGKVVV